ASRRRVRRVTHHRWTRPPARLGSCGWWRSGFTAMKKVPRARAGPRPSTAGRQRSSTAPARIRDLARLPAVRCSPRSRCRRGGRMTILAVDAHVHLWRYQAAELDWISDQMTVLKRDFLGDELAREFAASGVRGGVAVQARSSLAETDF